MEVIGPLMTSLKLKPTSGVIRVNDRKEERK
jgi:hypothetical protein